MNNNLRHGDVVLYQITEEEFNKINGKILDHNGVWILAKGEATNSEHRLTVEKPGNLIVKQDAEGRMYFALMEEASISHTHDHETIKTPKRIFYKQGAERELDHFANSTIRKVVD